MLQETVKAMYQIHYRNEIGPHLTSEVKTAIAKRISEMTLRAPIWLDRETDHIESFPELQPYVQVRLTGLYLCAIMDAIVGELCETEKEVRDEPI